MWCWFYPCCEASVPFTSILGPRQRWVSHPVFSLREISPFISSDERSEPRRTNEKTWWPRVAPNQWSLFSVFFRMPVAGDFLRYIPNRQLVHRLPNLRTWMDNGKLLLGLTLWWSKVSDQQYNSLKFSMVHKQAPSFLGHFVLGLYLNK